MKSAILSLLIFLAIFINGCSPAGPGGFQGGIHFRSDNEVGLGMGRKVAAAIIKKERTDGADDELPLAKVKKADSKLTNKH